MIRRQTKPNGKEKKKGHPPDQKNNAQDRSKTIYKLIYNNILHSQEGFHIPGEVFASIAHAIMVVICDESFQILECISLSPQEKRIFLPASRKGKDFFSLIDDPQKGRTLRQQFSREKRLEAHHVVFRGDTGEKFTVSLIIQNRSGENVALLLLESEMMDLLDEWGIAHAFQTLSYMHSGLAHHLKNLLLPLNLYLSDINNLDEEDLQIVHLTLSKMNRLIHSFLSFTEPWKESGRACTNVSELLEEILFILSAKFEKHHLTVKREIAPEIYSPISVQVFEIICFNLLINAIEASPPKKKILVSLVQEDSKGLHLFIADQGSGIPREIQDKIFTPFFTTKATGSGLGLSMVYRLVNDCGGSLELHSNPNGTQFTISLPSLPAPKPSPSNIK